MIPFQSDSDRDPEAKTAAELYVYLVVSLVSYLAFDPVDPVVEPVDPVEPANVEPVGSAVDEAVDAVGEASD